MPASKKKARAKKAPNITIEGALPKLTLDMPIDEKKIAEIQRCLAKGKLTISVTNVDLSAGRIGEAWLYD